MDYSQQVMLVCIGTVAVFVGVLSIVIVGSGIHFYFEESRKAKANPIYVRHSPFDVLFWGGVVGLVASVCLALAVVWA